MNPREAIKICVLAGEILLRSGAETYRVEDTMRRILFNLNYSSETFVVPSGIFASTIDEEKEIVSVIRRVKKRTINLEKVALINQFSRDLANEKPDFDKAYKYLKDIESKPTYSFKTGITASGMACFAFAFMFGGKIPDALSTLLIGFISFTVSEWTKKKNLSNLITNLVAGSLIAIIALIISNSGAKVNLDIMIISSLMPYVPGLMLTNAVRDIFEEDFLSGLSRLSEAVLVSLSLAVGVGSVLKLWIFIFGDILI